jgi:putative DNA methylase
LEIVATPIRKKLIEVSIPLEAINVEAIRRKQKAPKGFPTAVHKYWAQRPLATCRAVLFAQFVDDPSAWPDKFPTEDAQEIERRRLHKIIEDMVPWEASNDEVILNATRWEIARSVAWGLNEEPPPKEDGKAILDYLQINAPPVYDPFCGAGSVPLEAQRLGLRAYGSDLNPVAVLISKALVEIPPKFTGQPPVNPPAQAELARGGKWNGKGAQGLAEDVRFYGRWMRDEAEKRIGHLYPKAKLPGGSEATVIAWLWARTVPSPDPAVKGAMVPLVSSFVLSNKDGKKVWVEVILDPAEPDGYRFEVKSGMLAKADEERLKKGTMSRSGGTCLLTGTFMPFEYIRERGKRDGLGIRSMAIVAEGARSRIYLSPTMEHVKVAEIEAPEARELAVEIPNNTRDFRTQLYGLPMFRDLFTARQLVALTTFSSLIGEARNKALVDARAAELTDDCAPLHSGGAGATAYADAIATYLALVVDRMAFYGSSLCGWLPKDNAMGKSMPQQALAMSWDFAEGNTLGKSSSDILTCTKSIADCISELRLSNGANVHLKDARDIDLQYPCVASTDPPYYDNIAYADLSDFFYVWLRLSLAKIYPELFRRLITPKQEELVAAAYRHGSAEKADKFFLDGMTGVLQKIAHAGNDYPTIIYYAYKQSEQNEIGIASAGWATFLQAILDCGFSIDGTWPVRTESPSRSIAQGANALASSIVLVCRRRAIDASIIARAEFIRALKREMPDAIDAIRKAGVGPVDMQQSVIGPGMGVFTRFSKVLEDDDSAMGVKTALALINRVWEDIETELDTNFDAETQVALAWFATYGFESKPSGELITLANAKNIPLGALFNSGVFADLHGKTGLIKRENLPADWTPATDKTLTVWECIQHTARILKAPDGGGDAAARFVAQMGSKAADARALAYRLYEISSQKGWAQEALVYNELAQEWTKLEDIAASMGATGRPVEPAQGAFAFSEGRE